jgi:hypothetical protein
MDGLLLLYAGDDSTDNDAADALALVHESKTLLISSSVSGWGDFWVRVASIDFQQGFGIHCWLSRK